MSVEEQKQVEPATDEADTTESPKAFQGAAGETAPVDGALAEIEHEIDEIEAIEAIEDDEELPPAGVRAERVKPARRRSRKPVRRSLIVTHRWTSLVLGLLLLVVTTSGALVLYAPEYFKVTHSSLYDTTPTDDPISPAEAIAAVDATHPDFHAGSLNFERGLYQIGSVDEDKSYFYGVDPGTGDITGKANRNTGPMAFLENVHECFLTCDDYPGYVSWLNDTVPSLGMKWLSDVTWAGFILGMMGLLLLLLVISGVVIWWPSFRRFSHGFRVRWKKGRFARDFDLHKAVGAVAIPFLFMWALTGAGFEFNWVSTAWYSVTGGDTPPEDKYDFASNEVTDENAADIGVEEATSAAIKAAGGGTVVYLSTPAADDPTGSYSFYLARGTDQWAYGPYPGQVGVSVDRHDASHTKVTTDGTGSTLSNTIWDELGAPMLHYGFAVNGWWRLIWFAFGIAPLALAVTGMSTWLFKRGAVKRKKKALAERAAARDAATVSRPTSAASPAPAAG